MGSAKPTWAVLAALLGGGIFGLTPAQGWGQTATSPNPPAASTSVKPAPREPVHETAPTHPHTPVIQPHGPTHPAKPPARPPTTGAAHAAAKSPEPVKVVAPTPAPAPPQPAAPPRPEEPDKGSTTGLKLPRFAALRSDDVNMRAGPGTRYPIEWVYKRRDLPVEIEREFEVWRLVRDVDGTRGWVHEATLTGRRSFMVHGADATLRAQPKEDAAPVAILKAGVVGRIRSCDAGAEWCHVQVGEYSGYLERAQFWGTLPDEAIAP